MKKTIAVVLVLALALFAVSAKQSNEIYAGANLGLNFASRTYKQTTLGVTTTQKFKETDLQFGASGDYFFDANMGVSASVGMNLPVSASGVVSVSGHNSDPFDCDAKAGVVFAVDFAYKYALDKKAAIVGKAGLAVTTVKTVNKDLDSTTKSSVFAIDLKGEYRYNLQDNIYVGGGAACNVPVTASTKVTIGNTTKTSDDKFSGFGFGAYAYAGMKF